MEPFKSKVFLIPGVGIQWTDRNGERKYVDLLDEDVRHPGGLGFIGLVKIAEFEWSSIGLPNPIRAKKETKDA